MKRIQGVLLLALVILVAATTGCATLGGGSPDGRYGTPDTGNSYGGGHSGGCH